MGCEAVDNVPLLLIPEMVTSGTDKPSSKPSGIACIVDVRNRDFSSQNIKETVGALMDAGHRVDIIFLDCNNDVLQRRFTETRRKHPLAQDLPVIDGIINERVQLAHIRDMADVIFDTSEWKSSDLRNAIREYYGSDHRVLSIFITSFSFKRGLPHDADIVFDVRFLQNPFYKDELRDLTGTDEKVAKFVESDPDEAEFFKNITQLLIPILPRYLKEGKSYLTIAIGCTGGQHRSVFLCEKLAGFLRQKEYKVSVRHRDMEKMKLHNPTVTGSRVTGSTTK